MIPPLVIDLADVSKEFDLSLADFEALSSNVLVAVTTEYIDILEKMAATHLHASRAQYLNAIYYDKPSVSAAIVGLNPKNKLALMIEGGMPSFNMKEYFRKSSKAHHNADGSWWLTVPFRHAVPGAVAESELFATKMPKEIYALAKKSSKPLRRQQLPKEFQTLKTNVTSGYTHKAAIYEGLIRKKGGSTPEEKRGVYMTFRRVGSNSDPKSWIHRGIKARHFLQRSLDRLTQSGAIENIIDNSIEELLG